MRRMPRIGHSLVMIALIVCLIAFIAILTLRSNAIAQPPEDPDARLVAAQVSYVGVNPDTLTAIGCDASTVSGVAAAARSAYIEQRSGIEAAAATLAEAKAATRALQRKIRAGIATSEEREAYADAQSALATAEQALQNEHGDLFDAATAALSAELRTKLALIHTNTEYGMDTAYAVIEWTHRQRHEIHRALAHEHVVSRTGEEFDSGVQSFLDQTRRMPDIATALSNLATNLNNNTLAWNEALGL